MFIHSVGHYYPETIIPNSYFKDVNGITEDWIIARTGIKERRKISEGENVNTMALEAVKDMLSKYDVKMKDIDCIIGSSYSMYDTVSGIAHVIQAEYDIDEPIAVNITTACSTFVNALEFAEGYFASGKINNCLIVASDSNTFYGDETDDKSGHLWGDGAAAVYIVKDRISDEDIEILDIKTAGQANVGKGLEGVYLRPHDVGLVMPYGKDVFVHACNYMANGTTAILENNNYKLEDLDYLIPHQANTRIMTNVAEQLSLPEEKVIKNIDRLGNTGSASTAIGISENFKQFKKGGIIALTVFGGGYSSGAALLKK